MRAIILLLSCTLLLACSEEKANTQSIAINYYSSDKENAELVNELLHYDPEYLQYKIPSLTKEAQAQLTISAHKSFFNQAYYQIHYPNPTDKSTLSAEDIKQLQQGFQHYIPQLAKQHHSKSALFQELVPIGNEWLDSLFHRPVVETLNKSSSILQFSADDQELALYLLLVKEQVGKPLERIYQRAQFYEAYQTIPESVSLFYEQVFDSNKRVLIRISLHQEDGTWKVMGFNTLGL